MKLISAALFSAAVIGQATLGAAQGIDACTALEACASEGKCGLRKNCETWGKFQDECKTSKTRKHRIKKALKLFNKNCRDGKRRQASTVCSDDDVAFDAIIAETMGWSINGPNGEPRKCASYAAKWGFCEGGTRPDSAVFGDGGACCSTCQDACTDDDVAFDAIIAEAMGWELNGPNGTPRTCAAYAEKWGFLEGGNREDPDVYATGGACCRTANPKVVLAGEWQQCGGVQDSGTNGAVEWDGPTSCVDGYECHEHNVYYSQCMPSGF